ncbi:type II secretion system F family protein [Budviciaceae bacterium BWR-B9]|uniref:Type II secretion system F family protein n=1 Tax=Limnobaculum allomyrinae TaxID=2791986 RepID=A0ABS1IQE9_9GAMM|nr:MULTISPECIES: type II secretion system F family protein [Limnobaculum]MBK5143530.1 type II secretion system F family protein [Limnobaculum allomyrinae]MBV7691418.1 type II secretion system F family protein [Limnobaculum sp. M2-1]
MAYILALLFLIGIFGIAQHLYKQKRKDSVKQMLEIATHSATSSVAEKKDDSPTERLLRKSSKGVVLAAMLDKNILFKALAIIFVVLTVQILESLEILVLSQTMKVLILFIFIASIILLPNRIKNMIISSRVKRISEDLPFVIDMMAVCVQSGMTIENAIRYLAVNTATINPDISVLLTRVIMKMEVSGMSEALDMLNEEVPSQEVRMLASTLQQSIKFGSSVYMVLLDLSKEMREMQLLAIDEKVSGLAAKMSLPMIVFIMFPILALVGGPGFIRMVALWPS